MTHRYIKMGATGTVLVLAFVGLLWSTLRDGTEYFKYVDEVLPQRQVMGRQAAAAQGLCRARVDPAEARLAGIQVQGAEQPGSRGRSSGGVVEASYTGIVPDTFKDEAEVVLAGQLTPSGFQVKQNGVVAKCPSKYEAAAGVLGSTKSPL